MRAARAAAQAKINLWLHVGPRGPEGYHELHTGFQLLDLADEVLVRALDSTDRTIECTGPAMPTGGLGPAGSNLAFRAAEAYAERTGWPRGFAIEVVKNIPVGGGLGGGSSDAGAVLRALNAIAPRRLSGTELNEMGARLGSDVAFFAAESVSAIGTGRGEALAPYDSPVRGWTAVLLVPSFGIATGDAYRWLDERRARDGGRVQNRLPAAGAPDLSEWSNDFEDTVEVHHPVLRACRERLKESGARVARLSGSGSTVFGLFDREPSEFRKPGNEALVATTASTRVVQVEVLK